MRPWKLCIVEALNVEGPALGIRSRYMASRLASATGLILRSHSKHPGGMVCVIAMVPAPIVEMEAETCSPCGPQGGPTAPFERLGAAGTRCFIMDGPSQVDGKFIISFQAGGPLNR